MDYGQPARPKKKPRSTILRLAVGGLALLTAAAALGFGLSHRSPNAIEVNGGMTIVFGALAFGLTFYILIVLISRAGIFGSKRVPAIVARLLLVAIVIPSAILGVIVAAGFIGLDSAVETSAPRTQTDRVLARRVSGDSGVIYLRSQGRVVIPTKLFAAAPVDGPFCLERREGLLLGIWLEPRACTPAQAATLKPDHDLAGSETPEVLAQPTADELAAAYPPSAKSQKIEGEAVVSCTVTAEGVPTDCKAESEKPEGMGFGAAAVAVAPLALVRPARRDGTRVPAPFEMQVYWGKKK
jgi:TonB family protein